MTDPPLVIEMSFAIKESESDWKKNINRRAWGARSGTVGPLADILTITVLRMARRIRHGCFSNTHDWIQDYDGYLIGEWYAAQYLDREPIRDPKPKCPKRKPIKKPYRLYEAKLHIKTDEENEFGRVAYPACQAILKDLPRMFNVSAGGIWCNIYSVISGRQIGTWQATEKLIGSK